MRRRQILDGARASFLQFGFAKTSIDDIGKRAGVSRPLVYRKFKNKEEILAAVFDDLFFGRYEQVEEIVSGRGSKRDKLFRVYEVLYLEPWAEVMSSPVARELYEACVRFDPEGVEKRERMRLKYTQSILGSKEVADVFVLAVEGMSVRVPSTNVLRRRIEILVEHFT
jgi:AcrR family transcriptional regulator